MSAITVSTDLTGAWDDVVRLDPSPGRWFGVPAMLVITAPTRAAAQDMADVIASERLPRLLDFSVKSARVLGREPSGRSRGTAAAWIVEAMLMLKAESADEARRDVERVCRRDAAASYLLVGFGPAREIPDQERLSPMCRRLLADATGILTDQLEGDLVDLSDGTPFEQTWWLSEHLPLRFKAAYDLPFLERWVGAVDAVGLKLLQYPRTYLACTAEELAAHAIIAGARGQLDRVGETGNEGLREQLNDEIDFIHECAFEDHDILMAFDDLPSPADYPGIAEMMGIANFTPDAWFTPFRGERAD